MTLGAFWSRIGAIAIRPAWKPKVGGQAWIEGKVPCQILEISERFPIVRVRDGESEYSVPLSLLRERRERGE